jgi:hypothetical protein
MTLPDAEIEVTVDGISYRLSDLGTEARNQVANIQFVDGEIARLQARLAVYATARNAYQQALQQAVPRAPQ